MATKQIRTITATKQIRTITGEFRLSFPSLFQKTGFAGGAEKYGITMLFDKKKGKKDADAILQAAKAVLATNPKKWKPALLKEVQGQLAKKLIRDGNTKDYIGYAGNFFMTAKNERKPGLVDERAQPIIDQEDIYPGCYCRASIVPFVYDNAGNRGVALSLQNVQKLRDGESFMGGTKAEDEFSAVETDDDEFSAVETDDDEDFE